MISYKSEKVDRFKTILSHYTLEKEKYILALKEFKSNVYSGIDEHKVNRGDLAKHEILQVGLDDLSSDNYEQLYAAEITEKDKLEFVSPDSCNMTQLSKCSARAKMMNKMNYGLASNKQDNGVSCACYTVDDINNNKEIIKTIKSEDVIDGTISTESRYLTILLNGELHSLASKTYSDNFDKLYQPNSGVVPISKIDSASTLHSCNVFTGSGIHSVTVDDIDPDLKGTKCVRKIN